MVSTYLGYDNWRRNLKQSLTRVASSQTWREMLPITRKTSAR